MKRLTIAVSGLAALSAALWLAAQQSPDPEQPPDGPRTAYALIITAGQAPAEGDTDLELHWPEDPAQAIVETFLVRLPADPAHLADTIIRPVPTDRREPRTIPRGDLPDGITVRVWPGDGEWPCAVAPPGCVGCEVLDHDDEWVPAPECSPRPAAMMRGPVTRCPCYDVDPELPRGSLLPAACRPQEE